MTMEEQAAETMCCPHCKQLLGINIVSKLMAESRMSFSISPSPGERLSARNVGGALEQMDKLLTAIGKEMGVKTTVMLDGLSSDGDGSVTFNMIVARHEGGVKKPKARPAV